MENIDEMNEELTEWNIYDEEEYSSKKQKLSDTVTKDNKPPFFENVDASTDDERMPSLHILNDECMDLIISFFRSYNEVFRLGLVCKRWYNLCTSRLSRMEYLSFRSLTATLSDVNFIRSLESRNEKNILSGSLSKEIATNIFLKLVSINCGALTAVSLVGTESVDAPRLRCILAQLPKLKLLEFDENITMDNECCRIICENIVPNLRALSLSVGGLNNMSTQDLPKLAKMRVFLATVSHHYDEEGLQWPDSVPTLCSQQLVDVLKLMPNLKVLDLSENHHLQSGGFDIVQLVTEHCTLLEELHLVDCNIPSTKLESLKKLKHLKRLFLGKIHCSGSRCHYIDRDDIWEANSLNASFIVIAHKVMPYLEELEHLSLQLDDHRLPAQHISALIDKAGPKFKALSLSVSPGTVLFNINPAPFSNRLNFIENFVKKCKENCRDRESVVKVTIHAQDLVHWDSCSVIPESIESCTCHDPNFDEIAPKFLHVKYILIDDNFNWLQYYPRNTSQGGKININYY